jgi:hypothetical protein
VSTLKEAKEAHEAARESLLKAHLDYSSAKSAKEAAEAEAVAAVGRMEEAAARVRQARSRLQDSASKLKPLIDSDVAGLLGSIQLPK